MGRKKELSLALCEQILMAIQTLGGKKGTTRIFNYAMNYNADELQRVLKPAYRNMHEKPERVEEYEEKLDSLLTEFSSMSKSKMRQMGVNPSVMLIPEENLGAFNREADRLKKEYEIDLGQWEPLREENIEIKEETMVEVEFYVIPTVDKDGKSTLPDIEPRLEYFIGHFLDYTKELGDDIPERVEATQMRTPEDLKKEAFEEEESSDKEEHTN